MKNIFLLLNLCVPSLTLAAIDVPLTIQETIYPGSVPGVARAQEPVSVGVPLPDDALNGASDISGLTLSGAEVGQFRILGRWPSGRIKWLLVDTQASLSAGQMNTSVALRSGGAGNFGGPNMATDSGASIAVDTGAAVFTIRKANFNFVDRVVIGATEVVTSGSSQGLVVMGPAPGQTTCPPCTTVYSSSNDTASTAVIEENGPAKTVIKATGHHVDATGRAYMAFTVRMYFYRGKTGIKTVSVLRNAEYGKSGTFATAYKGMQAYELRLTPRITGPSIYSFGTHTTSPANGTLADTDSVYLYQGDSELMKDTRTGCGYGCVPYTTDTGYSIVRNGTAIASGTNMQYPAGWADVRDSSGVGIGIGAYQMAAYSPKSLEFNEGGRDVRIGMFARQNSQPVYQSWPQWSIFDVHVTFHAAAPASAADEFLKYQHYLVGRPALAHYNATRVFTYPLPDPDVEDAYYKDLEKTASPAVSNGRGCCLTDLGTADTYNRPLHVNVYYHWGAGGGSNQAEFRWASLLNFASRGLTGRFLKAAHFYRLVAAHAWAHSDGFSWRDKPHFGKTGAELDGFGFPTATSLNSTKGFRNWVDQEHPHWYGMPDYYFMTGDETTRESMLDGTKDWYLNYDTYQNGSYRGLWNTRAVGIQMMSAARFGSFLASTGDPDAAGVLKQAVNGFETQVKPDLCASGTPGSCSYGPLNGPWTAQGTSRTRGVHHTIRGGIAKLCGASTGALRANGPFQASIIAQGLYELREAMGPSWADSGLALDLAYGISTWMLTEGYSYDGTTNWKTNGFRYYMAVDVPNACDTEYFPVKDNQTVWFPFYLHAVVNGTTAEWEPKFRLAVQRLIASLGMNTADMGQYQIGSVINQLKNPSATKLVTAPVNSVVHNGGGVYTISWTVPAGAQSYQIRWGTKNIVDWIGFDPGKNAFIGDPVKTMNWFAATPVSGIPAPAAAGQTQTMQVSAGTAGLTAGNFAVKASVLRNSAPPAIPPSTTPPSTPSSPPASEPAVASQLLAVSGSGQSGTPGQAFSSPLIVKVTDAAGSPVAGIPVVFAVTAGGGTLSNAQVTTNSQGLASTILTAGPTAGTNTAVASSTGLTGSPATFTLTTTASNVQPASMVLVSGNNQTGTPGQSLSSPLIVKLTDAAGKPALGVRVNFAVAAGAGSLSATQVNTDAQGLAATVLTLGSGAGTNVVTAATASLTGAIVTFSATATEAGSPSGGLTWTKQPSTPAYPGYNGYLSIHFDPVSNQTLLYGIGSESTSIYSTDLFFYNSGTNAWTRLPGTGSKSSLCNAGSATWPSDRHPISQMAIDTKRNLLWMYGGVCQGTDRQDMWYLKLNANPALNTWHKVSTPVPAYYVAAMAYDSDSDVLFSYGYDGRSGTRNNWVYCSSIGNPQSALSPSQTSAGCVTPDTWTEIKVAGGVQPPGSMFPGMVYDVVTKKVILYGGWKGYNGVAQNQIWAYDVPAKTWTQKALSTIAPPADTQSYIPLPAMAYNTRTNRIIYHQTGGTGAPADWEYDPAGDKWAKLASVGGGAAKPQVLAYDSGRDVLIGFNQLSSNKSEVWHATFPTAAVPASTCDIDRNGQVNMFDVLLAMNEALGTRACSAGDINADTKCDITDIQRVVIATVSGVCQTGPVINADGNARAF